ERDEEVLAEEEQIDEFLGFFGPSEIERLIGGPSGIHEQAQQGDVGKEQQEPTRHTQVHNELALEYGIISDVHGVLGDFGLRRVLQNRPEGCAIHQLSGFPNTSMICSRVMLIRKK